VAGQPTTVETKEEIRKKGKEERTVITIMADKAETTLNPVLVELDPKTWEDFLDSTEEWLGNLLMLQSTFRKLTEDTVKKIKEPHIKDYLTEILEAAKTHEQKVEELYRVIGRDPAKGRKLGATVMSKINQLAGGVQGTAGGAVGNWRDIHQLLIANLDAMGAFAIAEQLGLALAIPEIVDIAFPIVREKNTHQLLLQEYMLEMAPVAILYKSSV
jgi:hypothetical protein